MIRITLLFISTITFFASCTTNETNKFNNCEFEESNYNDLNIHDINNLKIYNGIKQFKINETINSYKDCLICEKIPNTSINSCDFYYRTLSLFDCYWYIKLFIKDEKIVRINLSSDKCFNCYSQLEEIFGTPNKQPAKILSYNLINKTYKVTSNRKYDHKDYIENLEDFLPHKQSRITKTNVTYEPIDYEEYYYNKDVTKSVKYKYYGDLNIESIWENGIFLKYHFYRDARVDDNMYSNHLFPSGIEVLKTSYSSQIDFYLNEEIINEIENGYELENQDIIKKQNEIEHKKSINQF